MSKWSPRFLILVCFHLLLLATPLFFTWVNEELFEFNKMLLTYGLTSIIAGLWAAEMIIHRKIVLRRTPFDFFAMGLLISQMLATIFSMHPRTSVLGYYTRFHGGLLSTISYLILLYAAATFITRRQLKGLLITALLSASLVSVYGISEHFGHSPSCLLINTQVTAAETGSWGQVLASVGANPGAFFNVDCWVQDVQSRVFATFGQPNWLAAYTVTLLPIAGALFLATALKKPSPKTSRQRLWQLLGFGTVTLLLTVVTLFTGSRSGFLGLGTAGLGLGLAFLVGWFRSRTQKPRPELKHLRVPVSTLTAGLLASMLWFGTPFSPSLPSWFSSQSQPASEETLAMSDQPQPVVNRLEVGGTDSGEIRKIVWTGALGVWRRYPIFGSGLETFAYSYYQDRPVEHNLVSEWDFLYNKAHNEFLNFLATTGLVGLTAYLLFLAAMYGYGTGLIWHKQVALAEKLLVGGWLAGVAGLSVTNFFGFSTVMVSILLFLTPAVIVIIRRAHQAKIEGAPSDKKSQAAIRRQYQEKLKQLDWTQLGGLLLTGVVTFYLLFTIWTQWYADHLFYQAQQYDQQGSYVQSIPLYAEAIRLAPQEALFYQHLAITYAELAVDAVVAGETEAAGQAITTANQLMTTALTLNPVHLNFYKAQARMYIILSQLDPSLLSQADAALAEAVKRAPTDAKLRYNRALIAFDQDRLTEAEALLREAIELKANYDGARMQLADLLVETDRPEAALDQYLYVVTQIAPNNQVARDRIASVSAEYRLDNPLAEPEPAN